MLWHVQATTRAACEAGVKRLSETLPEGATTAVTYGEDYMGDGRDFTGFHLGLANPGSVSEREAAAVEPATGGSYVLAQKWYAVLCVWVAAQRADGGVADAWCRCLRVPWRCGLR